MSSIVEAYLRSLVEKRNTGAATPETSFYGTIENLLREVGETLRPAVVVVGQLADAGAGCPDFGVFDATQARSREQAGQKPARCVVEVKPPGDELPDVERTRQVSRYWGEYRLVLLTNYRAFVLVGEDGAGRPVRLESFELASDEDGFWEQASEPRGLAARRGPGLEEFLRRVLRYEATLRDPADLAWFLASYARDARHRIEERRDLPALASLRDALEESLGIRFEGDDGEHFFRSTLVQTLFYGVFSAWVLWARKNPPAEGPPFDWRSSPWHMQVPVMQALFARVAMPGQLQPLHIDEVLDQAARALARVDRGAFFARFRDSEAVQYFYEPFLEAFDPLLREQFGVWYTPHEVVRYMVERTDRALREDLGLPLGLADENVRVLDPCTGTGSFMVETLRRIRETLAAQGDGTVALQVKKAAMERVFGFELLPAPFVVAHLQLGLFLQHELGVPFEQGERAQVFLTNALTGWEPLDEAKQRVIPIPELQEERSAAATVKQKARILVVIGNPPYWGFAGVAESEDERALSQAYREVPGAPPAEGQGLNDLCVRFFRVAERSIAEFTKKGIVCFITNYNWLDGRSHPGMRRRFMQEFDRIRVDCLNGDARKTGKRTPDGRPDPSVFSTERNREGIRLGTAIAMLVRREKHVASTSVEFRHLWGAAKRAQLLEDAGRARLAYERLVPVPELGLPFLPTRVGAGYAEWPRLTRILPKCFPGVKTSRDSFVVDIDRERLTARIEKYFDAGATDEEIRRIAPAAMAKTARFDATRTRAGLVERGLRRDQIIRYLYKPFDVRWLYWEPDGKLLDEKRADYRAEVLEGNVWLEARERETAEVFSRGCVTTVLADNLGNGLSSFFPLRRRDDHGDLPSNTSRIADRYLARRRRDAEALFRHVVAVLHAPQYRTENAGALRQDWPHIPVPRTTAALDRSAALGGALIGLLDALAEVEGVTTGVLRPELRALGAARRHDGAPLQAADLELKGRWGYVDSRGAVMAGPGLVVRRPFAPDEVEALADAGDAARLPGNETLEVGLNGEACWSHVPAAVWEYTLGGYQVLKKWLSYRERAVLGRALRLDEVQYFSKTVRRIAAILLLGPELDASYRACRDEAWPWPATDDALLLARDSFDPEQAG